MIFTGNQLLSLPQLSQIYFEIDNISINNYGLSTISFLTSSQSISISFTGGKVLLPNPSGNSFSIGTYNTGEAFALSGWYMQSVGSGNQIYGYLNNIPFKVSNLNASLISGLNINAGTGIISARVNLNSVPVSYNLTVPQDFQIDSVCTGIVTSSAPVWNYSGSFQFFNSLQDLLTGMPVIAYFDPNNPQDLYFPDIDPTFQNNQLTFRIALNGINGTFEEDFVSNRSGLYNGFLTVFQSQNIANIVSGLFNGVWSGNQFVYEDVPQSITLNYFVSKTDNGGIAVPETINLTWSPFPNVFSYTSEYVTGFNLTNSGEYLYPPSANFTGYYYVTGFQQPLNSFLFSSGCSGNLGVSFVSANGQGNGATGYLNTMLVSFQNIYTSGINNFYVVNGYIPASYGTGYTMAPNLVVNTGQYSNCYDVPLKYGYNIAWFLPSTSISGSLSPLAAYLTGLPLYTTGLVSGGHLTGYLVTGIDITNIGSGYNATYIPLVSFIRASGDTLINNASGILSTKLTDSYNFYSSWKMETGIAGTNLITLTTPTGTLQLPSNENYFSLRLSSSGLDNTVPLLANINMVTSAGYIYNDYVTGTKYFSTDTGFLKKKLNIETGLFVTGTPLSFTLSQIDLNNFYSSAGFTNNTWTISLGDLDF